MERYWLWLHTRRGLSANGLRQALAAFETPAGIYAASGAKLAEAGLKQADCAALCDRDMAEADRIGGICRETGIRILTMDQPQYPALLRNIPDPPPLLYYAGTLPDFDRELTIAVVGHRKPSTQGWTMARRLGLGLSKSGAVVISGAAKGIDAAAMEGALRGGMPVVAVLGCGVDVAYPRENRRLLEDVRDYGCILSEYPPGTPPVGWHFPVRNRIISGLSRGVVVVEAPRRSGSLNTAQHALDQGRDVFAVPGSAGDPVCAGSNDLLRQGAACAEHAGDIIGGYAYLFRDRVRVPDEAERAAYEAEFLHEKSDAIAASPVELPQSDCKKMIDNPQTETYIDLKEELAGLSGEEAAVVQALSDKPARVDILIERTGLAAPAVLGTLTMLEVRGLVQALPGGSFSLRRKT